MKCNIDGEIVNCKVIENLGFQGGKYGKVVIHNDQEIVVTKQIGGGMWVKATPSIIIKENKNVTYN